jgi:hypothetical protein
VDSEFRAVHCHGNRSDCLLSVVPRIVVGADVFKAKPPNRRHLRDVLTGLCPVEVRRVAGQHDDAAGWKRLQLIGVELAAETDVENAGDHCIDTILRVSVRHQLYAVGHSDPDRIGASEG